MRKQVCAVVCLFFFLWTIFFSHFTNQALAHDRPSKKAVVFLDAAHLAFVLMCSAIS